MNKPFRLIVLAIFLPVMAWLLWVNLRTTIDCRAAGGTVVQGLYLLECIR